MKRERRDHVAEIRATEIDGRPGVTLHCITPGVVDDYGSVWMPDAFDKSLGLRMPTLCWSHDWGEPLGPPTAFRTSLNGPEVDFVFSDFDAVPSARRAHAQVQDGTIKDCSVGFSDVRRRDPTDEEKAKYPGVREVIEEATLDEVSLVLRGAVPGAKVLAVRSLQEPGVALDDVIEIAKRRAAGDLSAEDARAAIELLAGTVPAVADDETERVLQALDLMSMQLEEPDQRTLRSHVGWLEARMTAMFVSDQRELLRVALLDRFQTGPDQYVWIVDFSDVQVIFELSGFEESGTFALSYAIVDEAVVFGPGDPVEVTPSVTYVPVVEPASESMPSMPMTMSTPAPEQRAEPPDENEARAMVERAMTRSR